MKKTTLALWCLLAGFLLLLAAYSLFPRGNEEKITYSEFQSLLRAGKLNNVSLSDDHITATLDTENLGSLLPQNTLDEIKKSDKPKIQVTTVPVNDPNLFQELEAAKVTYSAAPTNKWLIAILSGIIPVLLFIAVWGYMFKRMGAGGGAYMEVGKSKAKVYIEQQTGVTFADVAGVDEAKAELMEIVEFLKNPERYHRLGAHIPKGVLLVGPPGTGKTLLARAVAGESGVPFFSISGSEFVEMFVGVGAARVRDLFNKAREMSPAIIFIDELDALGRARGAFPGGGSHDEKEQTLNQLLTEMDGFDPSTGLIILSATNRPEILDPALLRAGRFDRHVLVDKPDRVGRVQILNVHLRKIHCDSDVDALKIAALTPGFSGADLANLVNEAALLATRNDERAVTMDDFTRAVERLVAGLEKKNRLLNPEERRIVAYHEMGHALVALSLPGFDSSVHKVSIIPRGIGSLGYTIQRPIEDRFLMTQDELKAKMAVLLGGRAAEQLVFGALSTGATDDLVKATEIAKSMVMHYGMYKPFGHVVYESQQPTFLQSSAPPPKRDYSEETAQEIDRAVRDIVKQAYHHSFGILKENRSILEKGAQLLMKKETLNEEDLKSLMQTAVEEVDSLG